MNNQMMFTKVPFIYRPILIATTATLLWSFGLSTVEAFPNLGCPYRDSIPGGEVDFGSGTHSAGNPTASATVTWTFSSVNGVILVMARVTGTLYLDKIGSGCADIKVNFQDSNGTNLQGTQMLPVPLCGPGNDANNPKNQAKVDILSFPNAALSRVQIVLSENGVDEHVGDAFVPPIHLNLRDTINGGVADFGFRPHVGGSPQQSGFINLLLGNNGIVSGSVNGILFYDSLFGNETVRAIVDFEDRNGAILGTSTTTLNGSGCCATDSKNQKLVNPSPFNSANLFKIRLRVGTVSNNVFSATATRIYQFGCALGIGEGFPLDITTGIGDETLYGVEWTVPGPDNWRSLRTLDVRLIDQSGEILRVRWQEASGTFSAFNENERKFGQGFAPGSDKEFERPEVKLNLRDASVIGSGPSGLSVLLNLPFEFKAPAAGRTFSVQVRATNDSGLVQGWDSVGEITVSPP